MKRYSKDQQDQLSYLKREAKMKNTINYTLSENSIKGNSGACAENANFRYSFHKKILAYELELY